MKSRNRVVSIAEKAEGLVKHWHEFTPPAFRMMANWKVEVYYQERVNSGKVTYRDRIYRFLASPASSQMAKYPSPHARARPAAARLRAAARTHSRREH